tara:strand:+ start:1501 stop:2337 length:837 start_codon:yes stop_codon:yes gene_type:complete
MAFWRWATMDSWDPFCLRFWRWGNVFSQSDCELVETLRDAKLTDLLSQIEFSHPEQDASQILCPLTNQPIIEPVISIEGIVYEKYALLRRIAAFNDVPGTDRQLSKQDVYDFKALIGVLQFAQQRRLNYQAKIRSWLEAIQQILVSKKVSVKYPKLLLCQLSNRRIKSAVITANGRIYDEDAITGYFETTGNDCDPIDGTPLRLSSLVPFHKFDEYVYLYRNLAVESADKVAKAVDKTLDILLTGIEFAHGFFESPTLINAQGQTIAKPGMDYRPPFL